MKKDIPCKWISKESWSSSTHLIQNRILKKDCYKRQRRTLHNDQGINPRRRYNNYKYICTQHRSTSVDKASGNNHKRGYQQEHNNSGDVNIPLIPMDRSSRQKINKETQALNDILDQIDLIDIYRKGHPKAAEYTFFSSAHGTFSRIDHILGHK